MNLARTHLTCAASHFALLYTFTCGLWIGCNFFVCAGFSATKTAQSLCGFGPERLKTNLSICYLICRLCICLYLSKMSDSDDGTWHALWSHRPSKFRGKTLFYTFHFISHTSRSKGGIFTPPHFISVQDESINLSLFNWASPLARSASAQEDFDPF